MMNESLKLNYQQVLEQVKVEYKKLLKLTTYDISNNPHYNEEAHKQCNNLIHLITMLQDKIQQEKGNKEEKRREGNEMK